MKIALFTPEAPGQGGIGSYTATLARGLAERGHRVWVFLPGEPDEHQDAQGVRWQTLGRAGPDHLPAFNRYWGLSLRWLPWARHAGRALRAAHARTRFDVAEVPEWMAGALFMPPDGTIPPLVVRLHTHLALVRQLNEQPVTADARLACWMERRAMQQAAALLANSEALADLASRDYDLARSHLDVLPLGIELDRYVVARDPGLKRTLGLADDDVLALFAGRIERRKGIDTLISAFRRAARQNERLHLAVVGADTLTGPQGTSLQGALQAHLETHGMAERVHWLGFQPPSAMPALYAGCDFLAAPSRLEPFGLVYLEAMASARPVIGCTTGGVSEIVTSGRHGLLVPPDDPATLAVAIATLAGQGALRDRMGACAREHVVRHFDHRLMADRTAAWYRRVAQRSPGEHPQFASETRSKA